MEVNRPEITVVSPIYSAENVLQDFLMRLINSLELITKEFEIILVEDGSPDKSWEQMIKASEADPRIKCLKLSRNFGQHQAITAGIDHSTGQWVVIMDCDLQDKPEEIPRLLDKAKEGYDMVLAIRSSRTDGFLKKISSALFYSLLQYLTGIKQNAQIANFGIYHRKVMDVLVNDMRESIRYFPMMVRWLGFNVSTIKVEHGQSGRPSSYSLRKSIDLALNVMLTFSDQPLRLTIRLGLLLTLSSIIYGIYTIYRMLAGAIDVEGWTSLIVSIWFLGGVIIFILGMIGLYLGKTFEEVKKRPIYVIQEKHNV